MRIARLRIENFRGIRTGDVTFGAHSVLIGPNNCGKTTVIEALALLFGRDRMVRDLTEHDFFGGNPQPGDRIRLVATITDFGSDDSADHPYWFREGAGVPTWLNPTTGAVSPTRDDPSWPLACQIAFSARFDRPSLDVETVRYFHDHDDAADVFAEEAVTRVPARVTRDIGFFLVPAGRTWDRVVSFGSELFRRVVAAGDGQPAESVLAERDRLRTPAEPLETDVRLAPIVAQLNSELAGFFRVAPHLQLRVTSTDSSGLLEAVVPHYSQTGGALGLPARRHGSGLVSLQHLLLVLQFGRQRAAAHEGFWMALEEPELHVPPPLQRRLVHRIQALSTQTFVTTHSPLVAAIADPASVTVLRNEGGTLSCTPLLPAALPPTAPNSVRRLFQLNRVDTIGALMHDVVLVPEGRTDFEWLRLLARAVDLRQGWTDGECRFSTHIGVIPTHDAAVAATVAALAHVHPRLTTLVDGDVEGLGYAQTLVAATARPAVVLRWPDAWTIEDVIGWILQADSPTVLAHLGQVLVPAPETVERLTERLKSEDRAAHGLKQDVVAYETVAEVIGTVDACCARARQLLNGMSEVLLGGTHAQFTADVGSGAVIFRP